MCHNEALFVFAYSLVFFPFTPLPCLSSCGNNEITGGLANRTDYEKTERCLCLSRRETVDRRYAFSIDAFLLHSVDIPADCHEDIAVRRVIAGNTAMWHPPRHLSLVATRVRHLMVLFCVTRRCQMTRAVGFPLTESTAHQKKCRRKNHFPLLWLLHIEHFGTVSLRSHILKVRFARRDPISYICLLYIHEW